MQINVKVNEKNVLEETYTITLDRDEIEQVEQALLEQRMKLLPNTDLDPDKLIDNGYVKWADDVVEDRLELKKLEELIDRIKLSHLFIYGENT
jgi:hypothetical protein|tara:strand:- start:361 stop:639 length:279 start_codon:yes stop_codon:yes gene_type:complete